MMRYFGHAVLTAFCTLLLVSACASTPDNPVASTQFDPNYDFSKVHKIAIQPIDRTVISTIMISDARAGRINEALTAQLQRLGYQVVAENTEADMFLTWRLVTDAQMSVQNLNSQSQYNCLNCEAGDSAQQPEYITGTFVVEMVDPIQLQSEWRSTLVSRMRNDLDPQLSAQYRQEAAQAVFAQFPPVRTTP